MTNWINRSIGNLKYVIKYWTEWTRYPLHACANDHKQLLLYRPFLGPMLHVLPCERCRSQCDQILEQIDFALKTVGIPSHGCPFSSLGHSCEPKKKSNPSRIQDLNVNQFTKASSLTLVQMQSRLSFLPRYIARKFSSVLYYR